MGIVHEDIVRVKENTDLVALISEHVQLKRMGRRFSGCCPFHDEKTPSFSVNPELGFYYCFGCQKKGDAITFLRDYLQMDFQEAVEALAKRANITLHYDTSKESNKSELTPLYDCLKEAGQYYSELLMSSDIAKEARQYVRSRGLDKETLIDFEIGYSPASYDTLAKKLSSKYSSEQLISAGLCYKNSKGMLNDVFRNRLMFPIRNPSGSIIGFGARTLDGTPPKYKNTSETKLYRKSNVLYNFDKAKAIAVQQGNFVVCEGYTDVIAMTRAGIGQAVATCGTAATIDHIRMMSKYVKRIILSFDTDVAGTNATLRWLDFLTETDADIYVARSRSGKDPAEVYMQDPSLLVEMVDNAIPFLEFLLDRQVQGVSLDDNVEERARVATALVEIIRRHPSELIREGYIMQYASRLGFEPDWFFQQLNKGSIKKQESTSRIDDHLNEEMQSRIVEFKEDMRQRELLRLCVHEPHSVTRFIRGDVFTHEIYREIFDALIENESIDDTLNSLREDPRNILDQILVEDIANVEEISPYSLDVYSRVVEKQMKEFLHQLVLNSADNTAQVKRLLDTMLIAIDKGDECLLIQTATELLEIKSNNQLKSDVSA